MIVFWLVMTTIACMGAALLYLLWRPRLPSKLGNVEQLTTEHYEQRKQELLDAATAPVETKALMLELSRDLLQEFNDDRTATHWHQNIGAWRWAMALLIPVLALLAYSGTGQWRDLTMQKLILSEVGLTQPRPADVSRSLIAYLEQQAAATPEQLALWYQLGVEHLRNKEITAALNAFNQVLSRDQQSNTEQNPLVQALRPIVAYLRQQQEEQQQKHPAIIVP